MNFLTLCLYLCVIIKKVIMTRKEKLFAEVNELVGKYNAMIEGHEGFRPRNNYENSRWITWKCDGLVNEIEAMKRLIDDTELKLRIEAYWLTDEGSVLKESLNKQKMAIETTIDEIDEMWGNEIRKMFIPFLNDDWVIRPFKSLIEIGLKDPESNYPDGILFGHSFEIYHKECNYNGDTKVEINYGTMGSFDPKVNTSRVIYLQGMTAIAGNTELIDNLHQAFKQWNKIIRDKRSEYYAIEKQLNNPFVS